CQHSYGTPHSF
nr:immunoglobulin light chain junction region [Macaca mulatta]MPN93266.1 immunoglobulin light chain junction region [Macaca mulatta]